MMSGEDRYELQMQLMHEIIIQLLARAMERTSKFPQNGYRRRLYFEGMANLGADLSVVTSAAAVLVRAAGQDLQTG